MPPQRVIILPVSSLPFHEGAFPSLALAAAAARDPQSHSDLTGEA